MIRIITIALSLLFFTSSFGKSKWIRACLDNLNNTLNLEFSVSTDCDSVYTNIYGERSPGAGFRLIGSIKTNGTHNISVGAESSKNWRLYLTVVNPCIDDSIVGNIILVDNTPPQNIGIDSVSVLGDRVIIGWKVSTSKDLKNYVLYYEKGNGLSETLDTIENDKFYYWETSDNVDAQSKSETYRIAAVDSCDISTGQVDAHSTIFLKVNDIDYCDRELRLERTNYKGWEGEVVYSLVYRLEGDLFWKKLSDFDFNDLFLDLYSIKENFDIKVRATDVATGYTSSSNSINIQFSDNRTLDSFYVASCYFSGVNTKLEWFSSTTDLVDYFELEFSEPRSKEWSTIRKVDAGSGGRFSLILNNTVVGRKYRLKAISDCGENLGYSNSVKVIDVFIALPNDDSFNFKLQDSRLVTWTKFGDWANGVDSYYVFRRIKENWDLIGSTKDTFLTDTYNLEYESVDSGICYQVLAKEKDAVLDTMKGRAETSKKCVFFKFHGDLPNAVVFNDGENKIFSIPVENLDTVASYINIYNRWGELVFDDGWEWNGGMFNDLAKPCQSDMYFYVARIQLKNREYYFISSSLMIFR